MFRLLFLRNTSMKTLGFFIFLTFSFYSAKSQESSYLSHFIKLDSIRYLVKQDSIRKDSLKKQLMAEKWDNRIFNPYKSVRIEFPFKISFEDSTYASPINRNKVVTSRYGWRWGRAHKGIDIDLYTGDKVMAMLDGKVRFVGWHGGHGRVIIVRHYNGLETIYAHLSRYNVKVNETVKKGQVIGRGGNSGNSRGSHVHIEVTYKGNYINPEYLFSFDEDNKIKRSYFWITQDWVSPFLHNSKRPSEIVYYDSYEDAVNSEGLKQKIYVVKRGDTLYDIAKRYNVSISTICRANSIRKNSPLRVGQELVL
mgnify:CR=1 FL=1